LEDQLSKNIQLKLEESFNTKVESLKGEFESKISQLTQDVNEKISSLTKIITTIDQKFNEFNQFMTALANEVQKAQAQTQAPQDNKQEVLPQNKAISESKDTLPAEVQNLQNLEAQNQAAQSKSKLMELLRIFAPIIQQALVQPQPQPQAQAQSQQPDMVHQIINVFKTGLEIGRNTVKDGLNSTLEFLKLFAGKGAKEVKEAVSTAAEKVEKAEHLE